MESRNSGVVAEIDLQKYIDLVYPNWDVKDKEDFDRVYIHLKTDVTENLAPLIYDSHREEEFEKQFDGVKVLPAIKVNEYRMLLEANKFIKAEALKVSISKQRFMALITKDGIHRDVSAFKLIRKEEIKEQTFYIIDRKYDSELGLQIDSEEMISDSSFI